MGEVCVDVVQKGWKNLENIVFFFFFFNIMKKKLRVSMWYPLFNRSKVPPVSALERFQVCFSLSF